MVNKSTICLLGASLGTGNLGVSALAWSSVRVIQSRWPNAEIVMAGVGRQPGWVQIQMEGGSEALPTQPIRFCANILAADHLLKLYAAIVLCRIIPFLKQRWSSHNSTLGVLLRAEMFCDITGGDSFSDIYGRGRLFRGFLVKRLCQLTGSPYVLLPQTYGPFKSRTARILARSVLARAAAVYSRDRESLHELQRLMEKRKMRAVPQLCPDVAFVLEPRKPAFGGDLHRIKNSKLRIQNCRLIGLNISGLLYNGGYTQNNQFGLACDYKRLVKEITTYFARQQDCCVLLVPHVIPDNMSVENDLQACKAVWQSLPKELQEKVIVIEGQYDQNEIKYIIGQCDFFLGSRMHATIAALSQCIPAVGMAYSKKFAGVFETVGVADSVVDMRNRNESQILHQIQYLFHTRDNTCKILAKTIVSAQTKVYLILDKL